MLSLSMGLSAYFKHAVSQTFYQIDHHLDISYPNNLQDRERSVSAEHSLCFQIDYEPTLSIR